MRHPLTHGDQKIWVDAGNDDPRRTDTGDAFVCEAWFGGDDVRSETHLSSREAGEHAERAGARSLVLTHIFHESDLGMACAAAQTADNGPVIAAAPDQVLPIS